MKTIRLSLAAALLGASLAAAAPEPAPEFTPALEAIKSPLLDEKIRDALKKKLQDGLNDPAVLNQVLDSLRSGAGGSAGNIGALAGALKNLNVRFKAFEAKDGADASLGLEYSYEKSLKHHELDARLGHPLSLSFTLRAKGNIAFDPKRNPADFLDTGASFDLFGSKGGFEPVVESRRWQTELNALTQLASEFTGTPEELDASPVWKEIESRVNAQLSTQYFWRASGNFSLESNQDFTQRQYAYGLLVSGVIRAWNPKSAWADFNLFDWPFAGLRYLTGADSSFQPSGHALPLVLVGLEQVDPQKNAGRLALDPDDSKYGRWRGELAMKTKVARIGGKDVWAFGSYRVFREISPSAAIRNAGLARSEYWAVGVEMENGLGFTYSKGRLPFDRKSEQVFDLGYKFNLK
ncbi:MAG: hypothetical protein HY302_05355 [Opitutae bacterium]|nr:hypothetical protein [Opitutae bacterium]